MAMPLPAERNRYTDAVKKGRDWGNKRGDTRGKERGREGRSERERRREHTLKRSRQNPFLREVDTYMSSVSFLRLIQHTELIAGDIRGK